MHILIILIIVKIDNLSHFRGFLEGFWRVFGGFLEGFWRVFGGFLEGFWREKF